MTMRSPVFTMLWAMLWENWRLTRVEVAWRLALGIVGGTAVLAVFSSQREAIKDFGAAIALSLIVLPHFVGWLSMAKLNGGRPGFPLYLLYTRPVRTSGTRRRSDGVLHRGCRRRYTSCRRFS